MCTCAEKVVAAPSIEKPESVPSKEQKKLKEQPGFVPTTEQITAPQGYRTTAPWMKQLEGAPTNHPTPLQFMNAPSLQPPVRPPYPFSKYDGDYAFSMEYQEGDQEVDQNSITDSDSGLG